MGWVGLWKPCRIVDGSYDDLWEGREECAVSRGLESGSLEVESRSEREL